MVMQLKIVGKGKGGLGYSPHYKLCCAEWDSKAALFMEMMSIIYNNIVYICAC